MIFFFFGCCCQFINGNLKVFLTRRVLGISATAWRECFCVFDAEDRFFAVFKSEEVPFICLLFVGALHTKRPFWLQDQRNPLLVVYNLQMITAAFEVPFFFLLLLFCSCSSFVAAWVIVLTRSHLIEIRSEMMWILGCLNLWWRSAASRCGCVRETTRTWHSGWPWSRADVDCRPWKYKLDFI